MMMHGYGYGMTGWMWGTGAFLIMLSILTVALIWALVPSTGRIGAAADPGPQPSASSARQILDQRYAHGDIGTDE